MREYIDKSAISVTEFAKQIGVSRQAVYDYMSGEKMPKRATMQNIEAVTRGKVKPQDFY